MSSLSSEQCANRSEVAKLAGDPEPPKCHPDSQKAVEQKAHVPVHVHMGHTPEITQPCTPSCNSGP